MGAVPGAARENGSAPTGPNGVPDEARDGAPAEDHVPAEDVPPELAAAFRSGGELGVRIRDLDWSTTALPQPRHWSPAMRHAVARMLASRAQIVSFWGPEMTTLYNDAYAPTMGVKHPAGLGRPGRELWNEAWDVLGPLLQGVVRDGRSFWATDHEFRLERHGYLEETYFDVSYDPVLVEDGSVGGLFCIVTETTARVLTERRVRTLSALGSRLAEPNDERALGAEATTVLCENAADMPFAMLYLTGSEDGTIWLAGSCGPDGSRALVERAPADGGPQAGRAAIADVIATGAVRQVPTRDLIAGAPDAADAALVLPLSTGSQVLGALVVGASRLLAMDDPYRDFFHLVAAQISGAVSNLRAHQEERRRVAALAALDRAKTTFFSNISHEFRTPLTLILGPLEDALAGPVPAAYRESLVLMHRNALRLLKLVNTVLDFSRLESGRISARYAPTDLPDYTARLASVFRSAIDRAGLRLLVDCPPLPQPVYVDRDLWEKIVLNLLSNALKFTFDGEIGVRVRDDGDAAVLRVSDTGVGVPATELPHLFTRFHRVVGARARSHEGTGIGLALVQELAELHGGWVGVDSTENAGTTFEVRIPYGTAHLPGDRVIAEPPALAHAGSAHAYVEEALRWSDVPGPEGFGADWFAMAAGQQPPADAEATSGPGRILFVDDNADLRDHVGRLLSARWSVVAVPDGQAALDAALAGGFDLVLTDVMMPGLDGFTLVARLRADPRTRDLPIIILSARAGQEASVEGLAAGADDYLVKPFTAQELVARVRANLELGLQRARIVHQLRRLTDAAVALYAAPSPREVARVAAEQARALVGAGRAVVVADGHRHEEGVAPQAAPDAACTVPLISTNGSELGEIRVWPAGQGTIKEADQAILRPLARLVALRTENARLYEAEHRVATTLQHSLLPRSLPSVPGAVVASRYLPGNSEADIGGDWYDVLIAPDGKVFLIIGDVVGKGVRAAAAMGQLRNGLRAYVLEGFDPGSALARLNRLVTTLGGPQFATVVCVCFDPRDGRVTYSSAGHPAPIVVDPADGARFLHSTALGPPIGAIPDAEYRTGETHLDPGGRLLLYTDGLVEDRRSSLDTGLRTLLETADAPAEHVEDLLDHLLAGAVDRPRRDDIALLGLQTTDARRFTLTLPADPTRLTVLRRRMESFLTAHRVPDDDIFDLTVAVSEAAANAIEHPVEPTAATISVEVRVEDGAVEGGVVAGGVVVARVRNSGRWQSSPSDRHRGRGLALIRSLAELDVSSDDAGTAVTMRRRFDRKP